MGLILIGVILCVVGAALFYFAPQERAVRFAGGVLIVCGVIAVIVGLFLIADVDVDDAEAMVRSSWGFAALVRSSWG